MSNDVTSEPWRHPVSDQTITVNNPTNPEGFPWGGTASGTGIDINWQEGPITNSDGSTVPRNGASVESLIDVAIKRLEFLNTTPMRCDENDAALNGLRSAREALDTRARSRADQGIDGTWQVQAKPATDAELEAQRQAAAPDPGLPAIVDETEPAEDETFESDFSPGDRDFVAPDPGAETEPDGGLTADEAREHLGIGSDQPDQAGTSDEAPDTASEGDFEATNDEASADRPVEGDQRTGDAPEALDAGFGEPGSSGPAATTTETGAVPVGNEGHIKGDHDDVDLYHDSDVVDGAVVQDDIIDEGLVHGATDDVEVGGTDSNTPEVTGPPVKSE